MLFADRHVRTVLLRAAGRNRGLPGRQGIADFRPSKLGNHADARDTSQMMAVDPRGSTPELERALLDKNLTRTVEMIRQSVTAR